METTSEGERVKAIETTKNQERARSHKTTKPCERARRYETTSPVERANYAETTKPSEHFSVNKIKTNKREVRDRLYADVHALLRSPKRFGLLAGPSPSEEIGCIRRRFFRPEIVAYDKDARAVAAAQQCGVESIRENLRKLDREFDFFNLDLCRHLTTEMPLIQHVAKHARLAMSVFVSFGSGGASDEAENTKKAAEKYRAKHCETTTLIERASESEPTNVHERAKCSETTNLMERAIQLETANASERASNLETTIRDERAIWTETTTCEERATNGETTKNQERARH